MTLHLSLNCKHTAFEISWLCNSSKAWNSSNQLLNIESPKSFISTSVTLLTYPRYHMMTLEFCAQKLLDKENLKKALPIKLHKQLQTQDQLILTMTHLLSLYCKTVFATVYLLPAKKCHHLIQQVIGIIGNI